jgi:hypothetical protein
MATIFMTPTQQVQLSVIATFGAGIAATVVGTPAWTTSNTTLLFLTPSSDGTTCVVQSRGPTGSATVTVSVQGVSPLTASITITVNPSSSTLASALSIQADGPAH